MRYLFGVIFKIGTGRFGERGIDSILDAGLKLWEAQVLRHFFAE